MQKTLSTQLFFYLLFLFFLFSCKKDTDIPKNTDERAGEKSMYRLKLNTIEDFKKLYNEIQKRGSEAVDSYRKLGFVPVFDLIRRSNPSGLYRNSLMATGEPPPPKKPIIIGGDPKEAFIQPEFLYPGEDIALLNENNEIEVADIIYKVTPYGTFITQKNNLYKLEHLLATYTDEFKATAYFYRQPITDEYYEVEEGIYLADTFDKNHTPRSTFGDENLTVITAGNLSPTVRPPEYNTSLQNKLYDNLPVVKFEKKTFLGKIWGSLFGNNEVFTEKFSSKRRVKVKLYNVNYVIVKKIGMEVSLQKKNWVGWSDTEAEELRLGWDALSFTLKDNITPVDPWVPIKASFPHNGNPDWDKTAPPFFKPTAIKTNIDLLGLNYTLDVSNGVRQGVKKMFDFMRANNQRALNTNDQGTIKVWRNTARSSSIFLSAPCELIYNNVKRIRVDLHRQDDLIIAAPTGSSIADLGKAVLKSAQASRNATTIVLDLASIYGVAKCDGKWLGARIEKK